MIVPAIHTGLFGGSRHSSHRHLLVDLLPHGKGIVVDSRGNRFHVAWRPSTDHDWWIFEKDCLAEGDSLRERERQCSIGGSVDDFRG
jgi:hypothetical protein